MNNYIFVSNYCNPDTYKEYVPIEKRTTQQYQKFCRLIVEGISRNGVEISTVSTIPNTKITTNKVMLRFRNEERGNIHFSYTDYCNISVFRRFVTFFSTIKKLKSLCKKKYKDTRIIVDTLNFTTFLATSLFAWIHQIKVIGIMTDMPLAYVGNEGKKPTLQQRLCQKLATFAPDGYLFLSEEMQKVVNLKHRPYFIAEGFVDFNLNVFETDFVQKDNPRVVMYAGGLNELYGLKILVDGFIQADLSNTELHLFGHGPFVNEINDYVKRYPDKIKFFGIVDNEEIMSKERKAFLLVNPRFSSNTFTKYSFPSKNMEYMSSGTMLLSTKLPSMPKEYYDYIFTIDEETVDGVSKKLIEIAQLSDTQMLEKGMIAKKWILENKNNVTLMHNFMLYFNKKFNNP